MEFISSPLKVLKYPLNPTFSQVNASSISIFFPSNILQKFHFIPYQPNVWVWQTSIPPDSNPFKFQVHWQVLILCKIFWEPNANVPIVLSYVSCGGGDLKRLLHLPLLYISATIEIKKPLILNRYRMNYNDVTNMSDIGYIIMASMIGVLQWLQ